MAEYDNDDLDKLLTTLRKHDVMTYKEGELLIQFAPKAIPWDEPQGADAAVAGGWKRMKDLEA
jgi:hypothetical protein